MYIKQQGGNREKLVIEEHRLKRQQSQAAKRMAREWQKSAGTEDGALGDKGGIYPPSLHCTSSSRADTGKYWILKSTD